jgi:large subunit ribosomal protein L23
MTNSNENRLMKVILAPRISEKSTLISQYGQYVFSVVSDADKVEVKRAVEFLFKVRVDSVNITNPKGKVKRRGRSEGRRKAYKKAYVTLASGQHINLDAG